MSLVVTTSGLAVAYAVYKLVTLLFRSDPYPELSGPRSPSPLTGHFLKLLHEDSLEYHTELTEKYGGIVKLKGPLGKPMLYISDPKALHSVMIKDADIFRVRESFTALTVCVFGPGLFSTHGEQHKRQRKMLNPIFTTKHLRNLLPTFYEITKQLKEDLTQKIPTQNKETEINVLSFLATEALQYIGKAGLGYSFQGTNDRYRIAANNLLATIAKNRLFLPILPPLARIGPAWFRRWCLDIIGSKVSSIKELVEIVDVLDATGRVILEEKKSMLEQGQVGGDLMSQVLKANADASVDDPLPEDEILAQFSTMIFAAFETTSGALARMLSLLAQHPDVQTRLREELAQARNDLATSDNTMDLSQLESLRYLDACVKEMLRLHPPLAVVLRETVSDTLLQSSSQPEPINIKEGTIVCVGLRAANRNKSIWGEDADKFRPERWLELSGEQVSLGGDARLPGIYSSMMTFGCGPRVCIGFKFAVLEMKVVLSVLIPTFEFLPSRKSEVIWKFGVTLTPKVKGKEGEGPQMPLLVAMV